MPIPELQKLREQYPQYNDIDDLTLATKLAQKYPQYNDLFEKAKIGTPAESKVLGVAGSIPKSKFERGERNILGNIFERPAAAVRGGILSTAKGEGFLKGYKQGAILPQTVPTFQETGLRKYYEGTEKPSMLKVAGGFGVSVAGLAADVLTNPADLLALLIGKTPVGKGRTLGGVLGETKPVQAVGRFLTKERGIPGRGKLQEINQAFKNVKNPVEFAKKVRANLFQSKKQVGDAFEEGVRSLSEANLTTTINLSPQMQYIKDASDDAINNPGLKSEINSVVRKIKNPEKSKFIQDLIDNPQNASNLTLQQSQDIKTIIQQAPSIATKLKQGKFADWKSGDLELLDLVDEIKLAQSELFPEMAQVREPYANYMGAYREVKNYFKPKILLDRMRKGFGNEEIENMIKIVLPKETVKSIKGFRRLDLIKRNTGKVVGLGLGVEATRRILGKTIGQ